MLNSELQTFIEDIKTNKSRFILYDEAATKQGIVLRILSLLRWNTFDTEQVKPEYSVGEQRVDYALRIADSNKVFIEVKKTSEDLQDHQPQLLNYSFQTGVKLAVLTNGFTWWFYLPLHEGSWEERKFYTIDLIEQPIHDVLSKFNDLLAKEHIVSGKTIKDAESIYTNQQNQQILKETVKKSWNKIVNEADQSLIDLIIDMTEKLCGLKPEIHLVEEFIASHKNRLLLPEIVEPRKKVEKIISSHERKELSGQINVSGKIIKGFWFRNKHYEVNSWKKLLLELSRTMSDLQGNNFQKVLTLEGRKRPWFTQNKDELRAPEKIGNTGIYVETNMSANFIVKTCQEMLAIFGYPTSDLSIDST